MNQFLNWAGYENVLGSVPNYAQGDWTVPTVTPPGGPVSSFSSIWPGLGQGSPGTLIQDGTEQDEDCVSSNKDSCATHQALYYFWLEVVPNEFQQQLTNLTPHPGDSVATSVNWTSDNTAFFDLCDFTQNTCVSGSQSSGAPDKTAEWIVERTGENCTDTTHCQLLSLANFGSASFSNAGSSQGSTIDPIANNPFGSIDMINNNGTTLASTGNLGSDGASFTVTWENSGP